MNPFTGNPCRFVVFCRCIRAMALLARSFRTPVQRPQPVQIDEDFLGQHRPGPYGPLQERIPLRPGPRQPESSGCCRGGIGMVGRRPPPPHCGIRGHREMPDGRYGMEMGGAAAWPKVGRHQRAPTQPRTPRVLSRAETQKAGRASEPHLRRAQRSKNAVSVFGGPSIRKALEDVATEI